MIELIAAAALAAAQEPQPASELGELRAYILSNRTGQYSDDISADQDPQWMIVFSSRVRLRGPRGDFGLIHAFWRDALKPIALNVPSPQDSNKSLRATST